MTGPLDLVQLRTLVAIADCGGFHRAASALRVSQSTVSQHVRQLERVLKEPLVEKAGRSSRLTITGEALLAEARRILAVHDEALERLAARGGVPVLIGCTEHAADQTLPGLLGALRDAFPGRDVRFRLARSTALEEAVARGTLDVAIVLGGDEPVSAPAGELQLDWYAATTFAFPGSGRHVPLVAFEEPCALRRRALNALDEAGRVVLFAAESTSLDGVVAGVRAGLGIALLPGAGRVPDGLRIARELPAMGTVAVRVVTRRGLEPEVERAARAVTGRFLRPAPYPRSIPA